MYQKPKPRILLVNKFYSPWIGGVEAVVQNLAEGLKDEFTTRVLCCSPPDLSTKRLVNNIPVTCARSFATWWGMPMAPEFPFRLWQEASKSDIVHLHLPFPLADLSWLLLKIKKPLVITFHAPIVRQRPVMFLYTPFLESIFKKAQAVIITSPRIKNYIPGLYPFEKKIKIIPLGIDPSLFQLNKAGHNSNLIRRHYGTPLLLVVGRLNYYKGIHVLMEAMSKIDAQLLIIGNGVHGPRLKKILNKLPHRRRIHFIGEKTDSGLINFYHACDIFILPSIYPSEAFGIVQLEAMAAGKPIVNTRLASGVPWVARHNKEALTVTPDDPDSLAKAINLLLEKPDLGKKLGEAGRKRLLQKFTLSTMLASHRELYRSLLK